MEENKQNRGGKKPKNKKKNRNGGEGRKKQKKGFHQMVAKFACAYGIFWARQMAIEMDIVATRFSHHCWMTTKMDLVVIIRW
jgi:hypothetical protein